MIKIIKHTGEIDLQNNKQHFDVGIYGWWGHENFGGCLTYFALEKAIEKMGYSVLMIQEANGLPGRYNIPKDCISMRFAEKQYLYTPQMSYNELSQLNNMCDKFVIGGDQMWNYRIQFVKDDSFLSFAKDEKIKVSYSTSFGAATHNPPQEYIDKMAPLLKRFDAISVREDYAVETASDKYFVKAQQVIDAVFLPDKQEYTNLEKDATCELPSKYLVAFILDPSIEKRIQIERIAKKLGIEVVLIPDAAAGGHALFKTVFDGMNIMNQLSVENFIKAYANAKYVITDSFHGTCMSYIFKKPFNVFYNEKRGIDRFESLMKILKLGCRRIHEKATAEEVTSNVNIDYSINWKEADKNVRHERDSALTWLKEALSNKKCGNKPSEIVNPMANELLANHDFQNVRLLATLFRDYGIKHIVLSPGGRDVPIIRMFENNEDKFVLHRVTDERSAGYFALGLARQLGAPVACVCTSGTAASNYLPAVTEAYYTGIPVVFVTADRYSVYLNQGEDQTIPQTSIYSNVVKKEVTLPENGGYLNDYKARRDISECILETTHNVCGPVHINMPIQNITIGANVEKKYWQLLPFIYPHILRVGFGNGSDDMLRWADVLKKSHRILLVYGQNRKLTDEQQRYVDAFSKKFNCVIVTDTISNFKNDYSINPYCMLNAISQEEFDKNLAPDILITVGGKRLMNDPLTYKVRGSKKNIRHWSVMPGGSIKDFYFKLTSVIDATPTCFFKYFVENAGEICNDRKYLDAWNNAMKVYPPKTVGGFNSLTIQDSFLRNIPGNSVLHLGVGQSFFDVRRINLDPSIDVYCNMGTNGIDGCTSTFMGQCAIEKKKKCFLLVGDLSFFYDLNSIWNKELNSNIRILMVNNNGSGLLRSHNLKAVSSRHDTVAEGWVKSTGFEYMCAKTKEEYNQKLNYFLSDEPNKPVFFEVLCD